MENKKCNVVLAGGSYFVMWYIPQGIRVFPHNEREEMIKYIRENELIVMNKDSWNFDF